MGERVVGEALARLREVVREAERLVEEKGGSFEGWLWYLLQPPVFLVRGDEIIIEYPNLDYTLIDRFIIGRKTHTIRYEQEEVEVNE